ncbi:MAG: OB-fold nucleic acid binding domain-containing protein, partial [Desulfobacterales bacterium]|nr:OB-fold nucleic acid binding domain-containing protein [Desulfobacterales bacterium]
MAAIQEMGVHLYPNDFKRTCTVAELKQIIADDSESLTEEKTFKVAGRMMAINKMGKSSFIRFKDGAESMQIYIQKNKVGDETYDLFKKLDIGDFIGVEGPVFQTRTGEWTVLALKFKLLSKAVRPLPEKFHGIKDPEKRYRQRYLDLIMNEKSRTVFQRRSQIVAAMRRF